MRSKLVVVSLIIFLLLSMMMTVVQAEGTVSMNLKSDSKLVAGGTVQVTLKITNINAGEGIDSIIGKIDYDKNIFETLTEENFKGQNDWNFQMYNSNSELFTIVRSSKTTTDGDVIKIDLKLKENAVLNDTKISISEIYCSGGAENLGGTGDISVEEVSVTIKKEQVSNNNNSVNNNIIDIFNNTTNNTVNNKTNNTTNTTNKVNTNTNTSTTVNTNTNKNQSSNLPYTGVEDYILIIILVVIIGGVFSYIRYKDISRNV